MIELSPDQVRERRCRAQYLHSPAARTQLGAVVQRVVGIQAQLPAAMLLALRARVRGLEAEEVMRAIEERQLVRTSAMRGTLHLMAAADVRWILSLLGPILIPQDARRRRELSLDDKLCTRGLTALRTILRGEGPQTREELVEKLARRGVRLDRRSQAPVHLIYLAALERILCGGPTRADGKATFVLLDDWVEPARPIAREAALEELARRYLTGYGPASPPDFAAWSGLPMTEARAAWESLGRKNGLEEVRVEGVTLWSLAGPRPRRPRASRPAVNLLPAFDTYVLGYADRKYVIPQEHQPQVYHGGQTVPVVLDDGRFAGTWRYTRDHKRAKVVLHRFGAFAPALRSRVDEEVQDLGRFWGTRITSVEDG